MNLGHFFSNYPNLTAKFLSLQHFEPHRSHHLVLGFRAASNLSTKIGFPLGKDLKTSTTSRPNWPTSIDKMHSGNPNKLHGRALSVNRKKRSETDHFVLHHCHRIQTVNSFWGLMLPFLSKAWLKCLGLLDLAYLLVHMNMAHPWTPGRKMLDLFNLKVLTLHGFYIHNCWTDWGVSQCWRCLVQHCRRQSLGNKTKVIRWLVGLIHIGPGKQHYSKAHGLR